MALEGSEKSEIIAKSRINDKDCGSPEVQIALLTRRLETVSEHAKKNPQDVHCQVGLLRMVSKRKRLLNYLKREDSKRYREALVKFGLRK